MWQLYLVLHVEFRGLEGPTGWEGEVRKAILPGAVGHEPKQPRALSAQGHPSRASLGRGGLGPNSKNCVLGGTSRFEIPNIPHVMGSLLRKLLKIAGCLSFKNRFVLRGEMAPGDTSHFLFFSLFRGATGNTEAPHGWMTLKGLSFQED